MPVQLFVFLVVEGKIESFRFDTVSPESAFDILDCIDRAVGYELHLKGGKVNGDEKPF